MKGSFKRFALASSALVAATTVQAQEAAEPEGGEGIAEIVVTAQTRAENVQTIAGTFAAS